MTCTCRSLMSRRTWVRAWSARCRCGAGAVVADAVDAGVVDAVAADPLVRWRDAGGGGFRPGGVGRRWCPSAEGAVRAALVVVLAEGVQLRRQLGQGPGSG